MLSFHSKNLSSHKDCTLQPQLMRMLEGDENRGVADYVTNNILDITAFRPPLKLYLGDKNDDINNVQSRDTLQSLVQSCCCGNRDEDAYSIQSPLEECKLHTNQQMISDQNYLMSFLEKHIGFTSHNYPPSITFQQIVTEKEAKKRKKRIRWTDDLHKRFMESIDTLGGPKKATPKAILKLMNCSGLTIFHIKSHLQKYRVGRLLPDSTEGEGEAEQIHSKTGVQIVEALRLQMDVQKSLYEQLESQKKLQMRIEEQAHQLQTMIQCQFNTTK